MMRALMFGIKEAHAAGEGISIHLAPDVVGYLFGIPLTNTLITVWFVMALLSLVVLLGYRKISLIPGTFQVLIEYVIGESYEYVKGVLGNDRYARIVFPLVATIFIFILAINWVGLLPGVTSIGFYELYNEKEKFIPFLYPGNTDLNITIAFALIAFFAIEIAGIAVLGILKYGGKFVNFKSPLAFLIGIIEFFSELARLVSFSFRLFGNIFAGKTLLVVVMFFIPFVAPVPLLAFEVFVGFIQAFIFAILTLFFIKLAIEEPH